MTDRRPIEIEAQLTYATALLAGCLYIFYEIFVFTKETGWDGLLQLFIAIQVLVGLQLVIIGMGLHIYFRGHWMAQAMVERWKEGRTPIADEPAEVEKEEETTAEEEKSKITWLNWLNELFSREVIVSREDERRVTSEVEALEVLCISSFYKTFQYLHAFLAMTILFVSGYGAVYFDGWPGILCLIIVLYLSSVRVLNMVGNTLFFLPIIKKAAKSWEELNIRFQRCFGLWTLPPEFHRRRLDKIHRMMIIFVMNALLFLNLLLVWQPTMTPDKEVYVRGQDSRVLLRFRHGGVQSSYYVDTKFACHFSTLKPGAKHPQWFAVGDNSYVAVVNVTDLRPGPCDVNMKFFGYTTNDAKSKSATIMNVKAKFLVTD